MLCCLVEDVCESSTFRISFIGHTEKGKHRQDLFNKVLQSLHNKYYESVQSMNVNCSLSGRWRHTTMSSISIFFLFCFFASLSRNALTFSNRQPNKILHTNTNDVCISLSGISRDTFSFFCHRSKTQVKYNHIRSF